MNDGKKPHPADESKWSIFFHGWIPAVFAVLLLVFSTYLDYENPGNNWFQRAGSITTVLGAYVAYVDAKRSQKFIDGSLYLSGELPYRIIAVSLVVAGTVIWGYGDLLL